MKLTELLDGLAAPDAAARLQTARVVGMLDETAALDALAAAFRAENVSEVKNALAWAGRRLTDARQKGYTTLEAIWQQFHIDYDITGGPDAREDEVLRKMQHDLEMQMIREQNNRAGSIAAGAVIGGALLGAPGMVWGASVGMGTGADALSSGLGERPQIGQRRIPPTRPSDTDIRMTVRRLLEDPNPEKRRRAAIDLGSVSSNPAALPFLAQAFVEDIHQGVREAAGRAGKLIYWNAVYWQMEQDGSLAAEIARRQAAAPPAPDQPKTSHPAIRRIATQETPAAPPADAPKPAPPPVDLADVLRRAEEKRDKRKKR